MQRLIDMSTSELVTMARNEVSSITEIGIHSELVKELTTRLSANTAAVTQALKERDEARMELSSAMLTVSQITEVLGTSDALGISEQVAELNQKVVNLAVENSTIKTMNDCLAEELRDYESDGAFDGPDMHKLWYSHAGALPATSIMLANIQAMGVEKILSTEPAELLAIMPAYRQMTVSEDNVRDVLNAIRVTLKLRIGATV